ncbi:MAG: arylsulfatase [Prolixibacteraceae bacterium]|nr:arylsulfatase [Prolixibacteraceae bacterium]
MKKTLMFTALPLFCLTVASGQSLSPGTEVPQRQSKQPNIIFIYADDMGYGELGCYGQQKIKTPNIDLLAKEGVRFTQFYSSCPVCAPARCMLLTGRHAGHSYIRSNYGGTSNPAEIEIGQMPLPEGTFTSGHMLQNAGYMTGAIGKWGLGMHNNTGDPNKQGFDYFYGYLGQHHAHNYYPEYLMENGLADSLDNPLIWAHRSPRGTKDEDFDYYIGKEYSIDKMTEKAERFIKLNHDRPFFLYLPYTIPHASLQVPQEAIEEYIGAFSDRPYYGERGYASVRHQLATYAAMITYLDKQVGIIMDLIESLGLDEHTIIMFSSDNGPQDCCGVDIEFFNSAGPLKASKGSIYEGGIRVPFIARWTGKIPEGTVRDFPAAQYDMMATFADIVDIPCPMNDGVSILPTMMGIEEEQEQRPYLYWEFPSYGGQLAIRMGNWKAVRTDLIKNPLNAWELYDLSKDIGESADVAGSHPDLIKQFDQILKQAHRPAHIPEWNFIAQSLLYD